jgi:two-component system, LytTR family, response regulator
MDSLLFEPHAPAARRPAPGGPGEPPLRVLIADDEADARERVRDHLALAPDVTVVAECGDTDALRHLLPATAPDLAFLDVRMPGPQVFDVLREIDRDSLPLVVFVTAYEQHALAAFTASALDYLVKPFAPERFQAALVRARSAVRQRRKALLAEQLGELVRACRPCVYVERLPLRRNGRVSFVKTGDIEWIDAARNAVRINAGGKSHLIREKLSAIERRLDPRKFVRIHRSTIVNMDKIRELRITPQGSYVALVSSGQGLTISRSYREGLHRLLGEID